MARNRSFWGVWVRLGSFSDRSKKIHLKVEREALPAAPRARVEDALVSQHGALVSHAARPRAGSALRVGTPRLWGLVAPKAPRVDALAVLAEALLTHFSGPVPAQQCAVRGARCEVRARACLIKARRRAREWLPLGGVARRQGPRGVGAVLARGVRGGGALGRVGPRGARGRGAARRAHGRRGRLDPGGVDPAGEAAELAGAGEGPGLGEDKVCPLSRHDFSDFFDAALRCAMQCNAIRERGESVPRAGPPSPGSRGTRPAAS